MKQTRPLTVLADDLTGACELAAIGHRWGLQTVVSMELDHPPGGAGLVVYDTETRLESGGVASAKILSAIPNLAGQRARRMIYKKTDSVMRGPISAELDTLVTHLGYKRVFLMPSNPALGRTVRDGFYRINGVPLHETAFAQDLHHPARSSWVSNLLGACPTLAVHRAGPADDIPDDGLVIGDAESAGDLAVWANRLDEDTLPAGAAAFFEAILAGIRPFPETAGAPPAVFGKQLLISGTIDPAQQAVLGEVRAAGCPAASRSLDELNTFASPAWSREVIGILQDSDSCLVYIDNTSQPDPGKSRLVRDTLASVCQTVVGGAEISHVIAEGGATAASIAQRLNWRQFEVVHAWSQGIVTLRPLTCPEMLFSLKPGSYPWPDSFKALVLGLPGRKAQHL